MDLIIKLYKNNELVSEEAFDGRAFYNAIPVHFAMSLDLEQFDDDCFKSTLESFEKRLNLKVSDKIIDILRQSSELDETDKYLLKLATSKENIYVEKNPQYFIDSVAIKSYGNCEDIRSFLEDYDSSSIEEIVLEKR